MQRVASPCPGALGDRKVRQAFSDLAEMWNRLAAQTESDGTLSRVLSEMELGEAYEALPLALNLRSKAA